MKTKTKIDKTIAKIEKQQEALEQAKREHRQAFRIAVAEVFNRFRLYLDADQNHGELARLEIKEILPRDQYTPKDLPE